MKKLLFIIVSLIACSSVDIKAMLNKYDYITMGISVLSSVITTTIAGIAIEGSVNNKKYVKVIEEALESKPICMQAVIGATVIGLGTIYIVHHLRMQSKPAGKIGSN